MTSVSLFVWKIDRNRRIATIDLPNSKIGKVEVALRPFFGNPKAPRTSVGMNQVDALLLSGILFGLPTFTPDPPPIP